MAKQNKYFILIKGQIKVTYDCLLTILLVQTTDLDPCDASILTKGRNLKLLTPN